MLQRLIEGYSLNLFSKKHIFGIILIVITILLFNFLLYNIVINYKNYNQRDKLIENLEMLNLILDEKKTELTGYASSIARIKNIFNLQNDNLLQRRIFDLNSELEIRGIEVLNKDFKEVFKTGSGFDLGKEDVLSKNIIEFMKEGYTFSFFSENDLFELQLNALSPIYDKYSIDTTGFIIVSDVINKEYLQTIANNIEGVIKFFKITELKKNKSKLFVDAEYFESKGYYIKREQINNMSYLIGYLPVKDFHNKIIGYFAILKPQNNKYHIVYKVMILSFIFTLLLIFFVFKLTCIFKRS